MDPREKIRESITRALARLGIEVQEIVIEHPADLANGDYSSSVALQYAKQAGMPPRALAEKLVAELGAIEDVAKTEIAGPGFINFYLSTDALAGSIERAHTDERWGSGELNAGKKIMIEYTDPNPFKEFHIGHLVPNTIGESISRLFQFSGGEVKRANYQGDVGRHVARAVWGLLKSGESPQDVRALGRAYAAGAAADVEGSEAHKEIAAINKKIYERSDEKINSIYDRGRQTSLDHFEEIYKVLGTTFDFYFFESEAGPYGKKIVEANIETGIFKKSDGAVVFDGGSRDARLHTRVFLNSEGLPTYEAKELGLAKMKYEKFPYDLSVVVTGNEINEYFKVLLAAMHEVFPELAEKTNHISHGMMRFAQGKMSSRTGDVITGESFLAELTEAAKGRAVESRAEDHDKLAQDIAVGAIKYQILKQASGKDIIFDRDRALSLEGDSGPYLQYAHARTCAILEKAPSKKHREPFSGFFEGGETLSRLIHRFPEIVEQAAALREPHLLTNYLLELAARFNSWYAQVHILDGTPEQAHKVALVDAIRRTLKNGLWLLGIPAPERM